MPDNLTYPFNRIVILLSLFTSYSTFSQQTDSSSLYFCKVVRGDSVMMFFNERNHFIEKECAEYTRFVRIDANGDFNGYFEDRNLDSLMLGRGRYAKGLKQGYFETFYPNGKIKSKGSYYRGFPTGLWEYYYENGLPERSVRFTNTDTLMVRYIDEKGNVTVLNGNGSFWGPVAGLSFQKNLVARGEIINGKPHGKWTSTSSDNPYRKEEFINGRYIKGSFLNGNNDQRKGARAQLNTFLLNEYVNYLEAYVLERCADSLQYESPDPSGFNRRAFHSDLRSKVRRIWDADLSIQYSRNHQNTLSDQYITIQFRINKEGKAMDFVVISPWGRQHLTPLSRSIGNYMKFPTTPETMYFHLRLSLTGGGHYKYNYRFSDQASITF